MGGRVKLSVPIWTTGGGKVEYYIIGPEPDTYFCIVRGWLPEAKATALFERMRDTFPWQQVPSSMPIPLKSRVPGGPSRWPEPRLTYFVGDEGTKPHRYSGLEHPLMPWDPISRALRDRVVKETGIYFDAGLYNNYRTGEDSIAAHPDTEALGERSAVVGLNFGGTRRMYFHSYKRDDGGRIDKGSFKPVIRIEVHNSDAYIMSGQGFQDRYAHEIPKQKGVGQRISLTLRNVGHVYIPYTGQPLRA